MLRKMYRQWGQWGQWERPSVQCVVGMLFSTDPIVTM